MQRVNLPASIFTVIHVFNAAFLWSRVEYVDLILILFSFLRGWLRCQPGLNKTEHNNIKLQTVQTMLIVHCYILWYCYMLWALKQKQVWRMYCCCCWCYYHFLPRSVCRIYMDNMGLDGEINSKVFPLADTSRRDYPIDQPVDCTWEMLAEKGHRVSNAIHFVFQCTSLLVNVLQLDTFSKLISKVFLSVLWQLVWWV